MINWIITNSVANIELRRRSQILPIYCANTGSVVNILPIYFPYCCKYMGPEIIFGRVSFVYRRPEIIFGRVSFVYRRPVPWKVQLRPLRKPAQLAGLGRKKAQLATLGRKKARLAVPRRIKHDSLRLHEKKHDLRGLGRRVRALTRRWSGVRVLGLAKTTGGTCLWQIMSHVYRGFCEWAFFLRLKLFYV